MKKILSLSFMILFALTTGFSQTQAIPKEKPVPIGPTTSIEFDQETFAWGQIVQGEKIKNVFTFTNTGTEPLLLSNAKGSCGCTVPEWPREAILPGETGRILVVFDSKGKKGMQAKRVTLTANTEPANTFLTIKGEILSKDEKAEVRSKNKPVSPDYYDIFPNPASEYINLSFTEHEGEAGTIYIFDQSGKLVKTQNIDKISKENVRVDVSQLQHGWYTISVQVGDKMRLAKQFIIQR